MNDREPIEQIKERLDIVDFISNHLPLKRSGRGYKALCPFHDEKTPSFHVFPDTQTWHCFGACGEGGDAFDFVQKLEGWDFPTALEELARRAGVDLRPLTPAQRQALKERRAYEAALDAAARHFAQRLREVPEALAYAHGRAWEDETIQAERLGYADGGPLPNLSNDKAQAVVGALNRWAGKVSGALVYVHREGGHVVYLAGRSIQGKKKHNPLRDLAGPKRSYLNGCYSRRAQELVIVEGQACAVTIGGWKLPALALVGSGPTGDLAARLKRHAVDGATIYVVPDGDDKTKLKKLAQVVGPLLRIAALPEGVGDVNAYAQSGATAGDFRSLLDAAPTWLDRQIELASQTQGAAQDAAIEAVFDLLAELPSSSSSLIRYKGRVTEMLGIGARDCNRLLKSAQARRADSSRRNGDRYTVQDGCHCVIRFGYNGESYAEPLCNFAAEITEDVARDNGEETTRHFAIAGKLEDNTPLPSGRIEAGKFASMSWVNDLWGVRAVVRAGRDARDRLREAIQLRSTGAPSRYIYTHTGWREIEGRRVYLHGGGALGLDGVSVELDRELTHYRLPAQPQDVQGAVRASLRFLEIAPERVTVPLWAAMYLAPLAEIVYPDFLLWLYGKTGTLKSTLAALALCHYGEFTARTLFSWTDTANSLEKVCFLVKDAPLVIDDFAPMSDPYKAREMERNAAQITRNIGNQAGRGRLASDLSLRVTYRPRGLAISTGELVPSGQSITARLYTVGFTPGDVDLERLTVAQAEAGLYPHALRGYLLWLAGQWEHLTGTLPTLRKEQRARLLSEVRGHLRLPDALAAFYLGLDLGLAYAAEVEALTESEAQAWRVRGWEALKAGAEEQARRVEDERPTVRFLEVLLNLLAQGRAVLRAKDGGAAVGGDMVGADLLGWYDDDFVYLLPEASRNRVTRFLRDGNDSFPFSERTLRKYMAEEGVLIPGDGRNTDSISVDGKSRRILRLNRGRVEEIAGELPQEKAIS